MVLREQCAVPTGWFSNFGSRLDCPRNRKVRLTPEFKDMVTYLAILEWNPLIGITELPLNNSHCIVQERSFCSGDLEFAL